VLYRLVTAQLPFKADTAVAMIQSQLNDPPTPSRRYRADLPEWLDKVLTCALAKSPADRYQTADQLREALQYGITGTHSIPTVVDGSTPMPPSLHSAPTPPSLRLPIPAGASSSSLSSSVPSPPRLASGQTTAIMQRRHVTGAAALFGALVVAVGILAYSTIQSTSSPPAPPPGGPLPRPAALPVPRPASDQPNVVARTSVTSPRPGVRDTPLTFKDVKFITVENAKPKENDALLALGDGKIVVRAEKSRVTYKTMPYRSVVKALYDQSRKKRYLTLQSKTDYMVLNLDRDNANLILPAIESRTGVKVQRVTAEQ
jgi:serine/threonine protein kinase